MGAYDHKKIEEKWQKKWEKDGLYKTRDIAKGKDNFHLLVEFPYPSGNLHVGHWYAFAVPDILARALRMQGKNALYRTGFDWSREVVTCDPAYYKWTQWLFLQLFKAGLVYRKETTVNWCPKDKTV